jgi:hypothetical protein
VGIDEVSGVGCCQTGWLTGASISMWPTGSSSLSSRIASRMGLGLGEREICAGEMLFLSHRSVKWR